MTHVIETGAINLIEYRNLAAIFGAFVSFNNASRRKFMAPKTN